MWVEKWLGWGWVAKAGGGRASAAEFNAEEFTGKRTLRKLIRYHQMLAGHK